MDWGCLSEIGKAESRSVAFRWEWEIKLNRGRHGWSFVQRRLRNARTSLPRNVWPSIATISPAAHVRGDSTHDERHHRNTPGPTAEAPKQTHLPQECRPRTQMFAKSVQLLPPATRQILKRVRQTLPFFKFSDTVQFQQPPLSPPRRTPSETKPPRTAPLSILGSVLKLCPTGIAPGGFRLLHYSERCGV